MEVNVTDKSRILKIGDPCYNNEYLIASIPGNGVNIVEDGFKVYVIQDDDPIADMYKEAYAIAKEAKESHTMCTITQLLSEWM